MKLSFIIPVYNVPKEMLSACVESIVEAVGLSSVPPDYEIIIVDDGSDEAVTPSQFSTLTSQFSILNLQSNQGLSAARNAGIAAATGDYVHFVDGDDMLLAAPYARLLDILQREQPDILDFNFTQSPSSSLQPPSNSPRWGEGLKYVFSQKPAFKSIERLSPPRGESEGGCRELEGGWGCTGSFILMHKNLRAAACCYIFRKDLLTHFCENTYLRPSPHRGELEGGFLRFENGLKHEDERFTPLLYLRAKRVVSTGVKAYFYRQREGSLQHSYDEDNVKKRLKDLLSTIVFLKSLEEPALERRVCQLTMDYVYDALRLTPRSLSDTQRIFPQELLPLPHHRYTLKYWLFSYLVNNKLGQWLLLKLIPCNSIYK